MRYDRDARSTQASVHSKPTSRHAIERVGLEHPFEHSAIAESDSLIRPVGYTTKYLRPAFRQPDKSLPRVYDRSAVATTESLRQFATNDRLKN